MGKTRSGLTEKQRAFARAVALGVDDETGKSLSLSAAYRSAYQCENMSDAAIRTEASKLASHPDIALTVERLRAGYERRLQAAKLTQTVNLRERVTEKLLHALDHGADPTTLTAARMLGESVAMFKQHQTIETARSADDLLAELDTLIASVTADDMSEPDEAEISGDLPETIIRH